MTRPCAVPGCGRPHYGHGYCRAHHARWRRHGDPRADLADRGADHGARRAQRIWAAHRRVRATRGTAAGHRCSGCGGPAAVWCYDGADPAERVDPRGRRYSLDPDRYRPSCRFCLRRAAVDRRAAFPRPRRRPALDVERAARLYAAGASSRGLAALMGVSRDAVLPGAARPRRRDPPAGRPGSTLAPTPGDRRRDPRRQATQRSPHERHEPPDIDLHERHRHPIPTAIQTHDDDHQHDDQQPEQRPERRTTHRPKQPERTNASAIPRCRPRALRARGTRRARSTRGGVVDHVEGAEGLRRRLLPRRHRRGCGRRSMAAVRGQDAYYTDAVAAGEPAGIWYGRGAEALGLVGEVDPLVMKALYTHGLDPRDPATARPGDVGRGGAVRQPAAELQDRGGDLRPAARAAPGRRAGGARGAAGRRRGRRRGSRCRSTTWCCRRRSRTPCCGWPASAPPATPPRPATTRPRPSTPASRRCWRRR